MRIASLLPSATEIVAALGLQEQLVAISHVCDYPPQLADLPRVTSVDLDEQLSGQQTDQQVRDATSQGNSLYQLATERLAAVAPDLIITQAQCAVCAIHLADVEAAVREHPNLRSCRILTLQPQTLADVWRDILQIATTAGQPAAGQQLCDGLRRRVELVQQRTSSAATRPRVVIVEWIDPLMAAGHWCPELVAAAGAEHGLTRGGEPSPYLEDHVLQAYAPDLIVVAPCGFKLRQTVDAWTDLTALPGWHELPAVRGGQVYAVDGNAYFNRSGPRLVDSLEILAHLLYPDRVEAPCTISDPHRAWRSLI